MTARSKKSVVLVFFISIFLVVFYDFGFGERNPKKSTADIRGIVFQLDLAMIPEERQKGLGGRDALCPECGMLFIFPEAAEYSFWMKDMRFDLDMLWFLNGEIKHIAKNISRKDLAIIEPNTHADQVLEINAGLSDKYGFQVGDRVVVNPAPTSLRSRHWDNSLRVLYHLPRTKFSGLKF